MNILHEFHAVSGLSTALLKARIRKLKADIAEAEKSKLIKHGFSTNAFVTNFTFPGHKINKKESTFSSEFISSIETFLLKKSCIGIAKTRRAPCLAKFGRITAANSFIFWWYPSS